MTLRRLTVDRGGMGRPLADWLCAHLALPRPVVHQLIQNRRVRVGGVLCVKPGWRLRRGQQVEVCLPASEPSPRHEKPRKKESLRPVIVFADDHIVVVDKPAGLTTMRHAEEVAEFGERGRRFLPPTLADQLPGVLAEAGVGRPGSVFAVHRLDKETSGLVVFARTKAAESHLGKQFRAHSTQRLYLALVRGQARSGRIESWLIPDRGDGRRGTGSPPGTGQHAVTHVRVVEELGDFTLVECRLETGRTHQVRIHLGEAGSPLCGERIYDRPLHGKPLPDGSGARRILLHAALLGFEHPATGERVQWTAPLPRDMRELLDRLRQPQ
jgi:23S rRNA pseudouridine1911/1915/1917 synthase